MAEFIKVAKDLEVKEISKGAKIPNMEEVVMEETVMDEEDQETDADDEPKQTPDDNIRQRQPRIQISSGAKSTECPECGKVYTTKGDMRKHYRSKHEGIKYPCNQCDYQATQQNFLEIHKYTFVLNVIINLNI